jgi:thiol-disulfide isomerase/thioredoxin
MQHTLAWRWLLAGVVGAGIAMTPLALRPSGPAGPQAKLDYTLKDMDGHDVRLASFRGRPMIINFWATWCGPCRQEIPQFVELVDKYKDKGFTVLGISIDDEPADLRAFALAFKINYPVLVGKDHDDLQEAYEAAEGVPISWFIRKDGTVALKHAGYNTKEWFDEQIRALF